MIVLLNSCYTYMSILNALNFWDVKIYMYKRRIFFKKNIFVILMCKIENKKSPFLSLSLSA